MVSFTIINTIDLKTYRQDGWVVWTAGFRHQSLWSRRFEFYHCHFVDLSIQSIVSFILNTCICCHLPLSMLLTSKHTAKMAMWYEALVKGTSNFDSVGSRPTPVIFMTFLYKVLFPLFWTPAHGIFYHSMLLITQHTGRMADLSNALV